MYQKRYSSNTDVIIVTNDLIYRWNNVAFTVSGESLKINVNTLNNVSTSIWGPVPVNARKFKIYMEVDPVLGTGGSDEIWLGFAFLDPLGRFSMIGSPIIYSGGAEKFSGLSRAPVEEYLTLYSGDQIVNNLNSVASGFIRYMLSIEIYNEYQSDGSRKWFAKMTDFQNGSILNFAAQIALGFIGDIVVLGPCIRINPRTTTNSYVLLNEISMQYGLIDPELPRWL